MGLFSYQSVSFGLEDVCDVFFVKLCFVFDFGGLCFYVYFTAVLSNIKTELLAVAGRGMLYNVLKRHLSNSIKECSIFILYRCHMQELADALQGTDIPILVKNPVNTDIDLWIGALERLYGAGIRKLGVIHRGFSSLEKTAYRNAPGWQIAIELRSRFPELPFFADPSHMGGSRDFLAEISQRAMDLGLEGLMIESHCDPSCALSDAKQQLTPDALGRQLASLIIREKDSDSVDYRENIDQLRAQIDILDENLLFMLKSRMEISRKIGLFKKEHNIAILQTARWDELLGEMVSKGQGYGLTEGFVKDVFNAIHEASVQVQNEILSQD